ncbi:MAG: efflux RND transporter periplasmic adaptor subunit [Deltaproteobacteria bacterium]|nr:efflux RND transporter periplasmic adaptor subunit [Deltaproteobacteria bacterium]
MTSKARTAASICALLTLAATLSGCEHEAHAQHEKGKLLVSQPIRRDTELTDGYVARIRAVQHIELRALERGYLEGIFVDEGQVIEKGARMFQLMPMLVQAEVAKARAETERAKIEYQNTKRLAAQNVVSTNELALAKANYTKANAELALATAHRGLTEIHAPFRGIMGRFGAQLGSLIDEGDLLTTLADTSAVWAYFNVSEAEYLRMQAQGDKAKPAVRLRMANGEVFSQPGQVETIVADFDHETGTIAYRARFANPDLLLRHGETGTVLLSRTIANALLVPQRATFDILDRKYVYVVDAANVVHARQITVAAELPHVFVVSAGLETTDRIVIEGLRKVRDGETIEAEVKPSAEIFAELEIPAG